MRPVALLLLVAALAGCTVSSIPAPGRSGDEGWVIPVVRWGTGPATTEGGPRP